MFIDYFITVGFFFFLTFVWFLFLELRAEVIGKKTFYP